MRLRLVGRFCALLFGWVLFVPTAFATSYTYNTTGTFGNSGDNTSTFYDFNTTTPVPDARLTFNGTSVAGVSSGTTISLGSFAFSLLNSSPSSQSYALDSFTLYVDFTAPPGYTGGPATPQCPTGTFCALLSGNVNGSAGGATITFNPTSQQFTAADGSSFTLNLTTNPIHVDSTYSTATINGTIVEMPEGSCLSMLGLSGMVLLGAGAVKMKTAIG
jgi:hypothetical protein